MKNKKTDLHKTPRQRPPRYDLRKLKIQDGDPDFKKDDDLEEKDEDLILE